MDKRGYLNIFLTIVMLYSLISAFPIHQGQTSKTITVPDDYSTIQEAINHADEGDIIVMKNGI